MQEGRELGFCERSGCLTACLTGLCFHKRSRAWTSSDYFPLWQLFSYIEKLGVRLSFSDSPAAPSSSPEVTGLGKLGLSNPRLVVTLSRKRTPGL